MKKLKLKRYTLYNVQRQLKAVPPRFVPSTEEIIVTATKIIPVLEVEVKVFVDIMDERNLVAKKLMNKKINQEEANKLARKLSVEWDKYQSKHGDDIVEVKLEDESFKFLYEQFQRQDKELGNNDVWGRSWAETPMEYVELDEAFKLAEEGK